MMHDILLSCLDLYSQRLPIEEFLVSDAVSKFVHPCEKRIIQNLISVINLLRETAKFAKLYGKNRNITVTDRKEPLQCGLYLEAFSNGIDETLQEFVTAIKELEQRYIQNPKTSFLLVLQALQDYSPLASFLSNLIHSIRFHKLHGCSIIQYLHQNSTHGDSHIYRAIRIVRKSVDKIFLKQLAQWLLYAKVVDAHSEFFIQCSDERNSVLENEKWFNVESGKNIAVTTLSDTPSTYADIWRYEIINDFLPNFLSYAWANKVLFIGQTVLIFKGNNDKIGKSTQMWHNSENSVLNGEDFLWNDKKSIFFSKIQALQKDEELTVFHFERVIDEIKNHVTSRLSEIAVNQADLVQQLKYIKDFYLLGRGEFFLEFIRQTYTVNKNELNENKLRNLTKAFEIAAHSIGVSEDLEQFSLCFTNPFNDADDLNEYGNLHCIQLEYKINWPLHLLFSPKVIDRYNILFRFLLKIKKMQYELHMIWCTHTRESKQKNVRHFATMYLRNQLMFFVDNLQYYIQVDVLESQFSILLSTILNRADFEKIQRAHSVFQANILSQCFLLSDEDESRDGVIQYTVRHTNNPVYIILNDIFCICEQFFDFLNSVSVENKLNKIVEKLTTRFKLCMEQLISLLVKLKASPTTTPLSQLLLHLDFNCWFSSKLN